MKLLLDTHALLWWATSNAALPAKVRKALSRAVTTVHVSAASAWEIAIKVRLGKLVWPHEAGTLREYVFAQGFAALGITLDHAERAGQLALTHRDPFDRMLIAQALIEDLWLVTNEGLFEQAGVRRYW